MCFIAAGLWSTLASHCSLKTSNLQHKCKDEDNIEDNKRKNLGSNHSPVTQDAEDNGCHLA
jgi:hypothetical protein